MGSGGWLSDWYQSDADFFRRRFRDVDEDDYDDDLLFSDFASKATRLRERFARRSDASMQRRRISTCSNRSSPSVDVDFDSPSTSSSRVSIRSQSHHADDSVCSEQSGRKLSSTQNQKVSFPETCASSTASTDFVDCSDKKSESGTSVCTERSVITNAEEEILPDGTQQRTKRSAESWNERSPNGNLLRSTNHTVTTETRADPDGGSSIHETKKEQESYFLGSGKSNVTTSTETKSVKNLKKSNSFNSKSDRVFSDSNENPQKGRPFRVPPNRSIFYDELDSLTQNRVSRRHHRLLDRLRDDFDVFFDDRGKASRKLSSLFSSTNDINRSENINRDNASATVSELQRENEALRQENSKLQTAIQDVTMVNKRWQSYNNDRRIYVQKLLSTIQDLQEQLNSMGEKRANCGTTAPISDDMEHRTMLEMQLKTYKDDWLAEKQEKEKAEKLNAKLEEELKVLRQDVSFFKYALEAERKSVMNCPTCSKQIDSQQRYSPHITAREFPPPTFLQLSSTQLPQATDYNLLTGPNYQTAADTSTSNIHECPHSGSSYDQQNAKEAKEITSGVQEQPKSFYLGFPNNGLATVKTFSTAIRPCSSSSLAQTEPVNNILNNDDNPISPHQPFTESDQQYSSTDHHQHYHNHFRLCETNCNSIRVSSATTTSDFASSTIHHSIL